MKVLAAYMLVRFLGVIGGMFGEWVYFCVVFCVVFLAIVRQGEASTHARVGIGARSTAYSCVLDVKRSMAREGRGGDHHHQRRRRRHECVITQQQQHHKGSRYNTLPLLK